MKYQPVLYVLAGLLAGAGGTALVMRGAAPASSGTTAAPVAMTGMPGMNVSDNAMTMDQMLQNLQGKTGDDFDKAFLTEMITHHQGAIDMAKLAQSNAKHPEVKDMADGIVSAQTSEITEMRQWQQAWNY